MKRLTSLILALLLVPVVGMAAIPPIPSSAPGVQAGNANTFTQTQTIAATISTPQIQNIQINGAYNGANLFNRAIQDNSTFISTGTGAYASYDTIAAMNGSLAYNHFYGYEARRTYAGSGLLNVMVGFAAIDNATGPVNAYRDFAATDLALSGAGSVVEQDGFYSPDLTSGSTLITGFNSQVLSGTNKYGVYAVGTAQNLFNGPMLINAGATVAGGAGTSNAINVTSSSGQDFHFATNTNLVMSGAGTITTLSALNDAANTYEPFFANASVFAVQQGPLRVGSAAATGSQGEIAMSRITDPGTAPAAGSVKFTAVCGTTAGTAKIIVRAGTSTTPITLLDNIGAGVAGC